MKQIVKQRKDIAFNLIMYPAAHPDAKPAINYALCAKTNEEKLARFEASMDKKPTPAPECSTDAITRNTEFARSNYIKGTPTIFLQDGTRLGGAMELEPLLQAIDQVANKNMAKAKEKQ